MEEIKQAAEEAVQGTGYVYDEATGLYFDKNSGYYYDAVSLYTLISDSKLKYMGYILMNTLLDVKVIIKQHICDGRLYKDIL